MAMQARTEQLLKFGATPSNAISDDGSNFLIWDYDAQLTGGGSEMGKVARPRV